LSHQALTILPFNVLLTEAHQSSLTTALSGYREAAWLGSRQPLTVLPSATSLKALRIVAKSSQATKPYLGLGNPLLDGPQDHPQWGAYYREAAEAVRNAQRCGTGTEPMGVAALRGRRPAASFARMSRNGQANIEEVRRCTPLPETADEICDVARRLGATESDVLLGANATETRLKEISEQGQLANYAILHFATHGALSGQIQGMAEPGLVLTPPAKGTRDAKLLERDDGYLTASEISNLKLDADWVLLSACNSAGPQGENAEALSGLARSFFFAGARGVVVSHWEIGSEVAVKLATGAFEELKKDPRIGRAEALRLSMKAVIEKGNAFDTHPSQWAPFVLVGDGAPPQ
jgi:CHAT domain-containing protein